MADNQLHIEHSPRSFQLSNMENPKPSLKSSNENVSFQENKILEEIREENLISPVKNDAFNGQSLLGFSLTSPDLVICAGSPDIASNYRLTNFLEENNRSIELSLENGFCGSDKEHPLKTPTVKFSMVTQTFNRQLSPASSFELLPQLGKDEEPPQILFPTITLNAGSSNPVEAEDSDVVRADDAIGNAEFELRNDEGGHMEGDYQKLLRVFEQQKRELEALRRENQQKDKVCQDAWKSLQELQNELMRKSMHVGSLAFAVEGQVKEKGKWFSSLRNITRKLKIMKMENMELAENVREYMKYLADVNDIMSNVQSTIKQQSDLHKDLETKFLHGAQERKELYNKVLELKGNIRVFCRCRPLNNEELASRASYSVDFDSAKDGDLTVVTNGIPKKTFKFDAVFSPYAIQADVFQDTAPFATSVLDGYNVCIFAYGQTGTGKTFTMEGTEDGRGVNFRTLELLFSIIKERERIFQYDVSVSVLEVYNEQIRDLLVSGSQPAGSTKRLEIRQVSEGWHHVPGLVEAHVNNMSEVWDALQSGSNARAVGSTNSNEHSSRSHCLTCVTIKGENLLNGERTKSKLWLVDLAGSERVAKTEVQGERLKETQNINKSLSALGDVISALATKCPHIPFRNSKLTHLLQDSLGGDSKTLMFVQISPSENDVGETLCSLNFASRVRGIELGPAKRQLETSEVLRYRMMLEKSKQELKIKDMQVKKMEETSQELEMKMKEKELKNRNLQERVKELESQLLVERKLARQHVDGKIAELHQGKQQDVTVNHIDHAEKENNNPNMAALKRIPKKTGRASICTTFQPIPTTTSASRRNTLIPLPRCTTVSCAPPPLLPLSRINIKEDSKVAETSCTPEQTRCETPKETTSIGPKKLNSILRRSLQKKTQTKSPRQQRKCGINVGMEKVRLSIGSRSKIARRVLLTNGKRAGMMDTLAKQNQKEKGRGWNIGAAGRTAI